MSIHISLKHGTVFYQTTDIAPPSQLQEATDGYNEHKPQSKFLDDGVSLFFV